ncbi:MAG: type IX secretion system membrane protein PorP/SprF [Paludibacter sp.]|nr:type IX secretion system membrane protein PorP/SprF [Paludibacter sp.]
MRKVVLSVLLSLLCIGFAFSQLDVQLSQYMFHTSEFNPAAIGEGNLIQITGQHRIQWVGIPNAPQTTVFSINSPLKIGTGTSGIGFKFMNDKAGLFTNQTAHLQYAFKKKLGEGMLSVGADLGFVSIGFHGDSITAHKISIGEYHNDLTSDLQIPQLYVSGMSFDMNVGVFYSTPKFYAGVSYLHVNGPKVDWNEMQFKQVGALFATGGYSYTMEDPKYVVKPSMLFKTDFTTLQLDLSTRVEFNNKYWGGLSYRWGDAVVFLAGINLAGGLGVGYSYDLPVSKIILGSSGSHEILLTYSFEYVFGKRTSKFKSIRIL